MERENYNDSSFSEDLVNHKPVKRAGFVGVSLVISTPIPYEQILAKRMLIH